MPYRGGNRLPGETTSRLGHLDVLKSDLVTELCKCFEDNSHNKSLNQPDWESIPSGAEPLRLIFGVDGSVQVIKSETRPYRSLAFVKTALLRLDENALSAIDKDSPHPFSLRDILADSALYHATVFPLRNVVLANMTTYDAIRQIIFESIKDKSLNSEPMETLKWIAYQKWDKVPKPLPLFECPHCSRVVATLQYDQEEGDCPGCGGHLYLTDMLGFHQEMSMDQAPDTVATAYMTIHETLLLFTGIRYFWEGNRGVLSQCLFVKDGPFSIRAQYSKLVSPVRRFLGHARGLGQPVYLLGQEKTGAFYDNLQMIMEDAPERSLFIPKDRYIKESIQGRRNSGAPYGQDTNYGAKVLVKLNSYHSMVLNIPTGEFTSNPSLSDLIGADRIFATIPKILSNRFEGALLPVELAHGVASLSTYPSAHILKIFAESMGSL